MKNSIRYRRGIAAIIVAGLVTVSASAQTPAPAATPAATGETSFNESDVFFDTYAKAAKEVKSRKDQMALGTMDEAVRKLATSPWAEVAMLKRAELNENVNLASALDDYLTLRTRVEKSPYFAGSAPHVRLFQQALSGAISRGITRTRILRIRSALTTYHALNLQYPESVAKLAIHGYISQDDIKDANGQFIAYIPRPQHFAQLTPQVRYQEYELPRIRPEPFTVNSPRLDGTSLSSEAPRKYVGLLRVPKRTDPVRVQENESLGGYIVVIVAARGAIVCAPDRVLVLPVPE